MQQLWGYLINLKSDNQGKILDESEGLPV